MSMPFEKTNIKTMELKNRLVRSETHAGMASLEKRLEEIWSVLGKNGIDLEFLLSRSMLSPATCCLVNPDGEKTVEEAFKMIKQLSERLRVKYELL